MEQILIGAITIVIAISIFAQQDASIRAKTKISVLTVYVCGLLIWPFLWKYLLQNEATNTSSYPSFIWTFVILLIEIYMMKYHTFEDQVKSKKGLLSMDANAICTLTFALSSILGAQNNACCSNMFTVAVLGCIAFVMPTPNAPSHAIESVVIETIQKVCLTYSTGFLLAGSLILTSKEK